MSKPSSKTFIKRDQNRFIKNDLKQVREVKQSFIAYVVPQFYNTDNSNINMKLVKCRSCRPDSMITARRLATECTWMIVINYVILLVMYISM